ncbi:Mu transposase C-terminal domain-containing protein [Kribbella sp. NPDC058245]|uniref:Mu transposase C-terminal domain-containing protein n=1 Tax=Kribbella sp. NPDC058245 TaxID=3346399 RepID=UPI0036E0B477
MGESEVSERGVLTASDELWETAVRQAAVISRLAALDAASVTAVDEAATELGLSRRQVYALLGRWRTGGGVVSDLLPGRSTGGRGGSRLPDDVEVIVQQVLQARYLTCQRRSVAAICREITRLCRVRGLKVPSRGTVLRRVAQLDPLKATQARQGRDAARTKQSAGGAPPPITQLLQQVQMDHTPVDVIVVDERHRLPIGRPYVTVAIDVASRCIVGLVVTLEAPSATSVGLCLARMVTNKQAWLEQLGVDAVWPMGGKPYELYVDNASEFKSEALRRGCEQHGIEVSYRPPGLPHFGGIVERVIGTMMRLVHDELPGTTFSNVAERGAYDSDGRAVMTMTELNAWLVLAVANYHGQIHDGLSRTPAAVWTELAQRDGTPGMVSNETAFLIDFLPVIRRTITRSGFLVDHVQYYCDALKPWIAQRAQLGKFVLRRDPRDISRIWALDPDGTTYLPVPYRILSRPPISIWEQQAAISRLREQGRADVDEQALFATVAQMRDITDTAAATTRKARRDRERRTAVTAAIAPVVLPPADTPPSAVKPFEVIEQW